MSQSGCSIVSGIVTLLTDFGESDWYVSAVKGVILTRFPSCKLIDVTHRIWPGDIYNGAYVLKQTYAYFPAGSVHMAVVDPGVGGARRPLLVETSGQWFVGPDNGLFGPVLQEEGGGVVRHLQNEEFFLHPVSSTFHGRDVFAPVAAYVASGEEVANLGPVIEDWIRLEIPRPQYEKDEVVGQITYVDRFGNGITNIRWDDIVKHLGGTACDVLVGTLALRGIRGTYVDAPKGQPLAVIGSSGFLEISIHGGNAQTELGLESGGTTVSVRQAE